MGPERLASSHERRRPKVPEGWREVGKPGPKEGGCRHRPRVRAIAWEGQGRGEGPTGQWPPPQLPQKAQPPLGR